MSDVLKTIKGVGAHAITRPLDLGEFDEVYAGAIFRVWVNPSRDHLAEWGTIAVEVNAARKAANELDDPDAAKDLRREALETYRTRSIAWYAETWTNIDLDEALQIRDTLEEDNPLAWDWLTGRTSKMIGDYREEKLKN